jgi:hypothetical protein
MIPCMSSTSLHVNPSEISECNEISKGEHLHPGRYLKVQDQGSGPLSFHLCMNFHHANDGTLCITSLKYIEKMIGNYEILYGVVQAECHITRIILRWTYLICSMQKVSTFYLSIIGALQWAVAIGWFEISTAVMTLSGFWFCTKAWTS